MKSPKNSTGQSTNTSIPLDDRVAIEQMLLFCQQKHLIVAMAVTILCVALFFWKSAPLSHLVLLLVFTLIVMAVRFRTITEFPKLSPLQINIRAWKKRFSRTVFLSGGVFVLMEIIGYTALDHARWVGIH